MKPALDALAEAGYSVERINVDERPNVARKYGIGVIPCFVVVQRGREIDRITGVSHDNRAAQAEAEIAERGPRKPGNPRPPPLVWPDETLKLL